MKRAAARAFVVAVIGISLLGSRLAPNDPFKTNIGLPLQPPGTFVFGTDALGRDLFSRVLHGAFSTLACGVGAALIAWTAGAVVGTLSVTGPRIVRSVARMIVVALLTLPSLMIALVIVSGLGATSMSTLLAAGIAHIGISSQVWAGSVRRAYEEPHIEGARAIGAHPTTVLLFHVLPNVIETTIAYASTLVASSILLSSGLSFLGLTGDPSSTDWGNIIAEGRVAIRYAPWILLFPTAALLSVTTAFNLVATGFTRHRLSFQRLPWNRLDNP